MKTIAEIKSDLTEEIDGAGALTIAFVIPAIVVLLAQFVGGALPWSEITNPAIVLGAVASFEILYLSFLGLHRYFHQWELNAVGVMFFVFFAEFIQLILVSWDQGSIGTYFAGNYTWLLAQIVVAVIAGFFVTVFEAVYEK